MCLDEPVSGHYKTMSISDVQQAAVTSLCNMTAFVTADSVHLTDSSSELKSVKNS
jgi:hypothetical protein